MNDELIKRIDMAEPHCDEYMRELLANCRAEIERLSKPYVPMTDDERNEMMWAWPWDENKTPWALTKHIETTAIKRYNSQRGVE